MAQMRMGILLICLLMFDSYKVADALSGAEIQSLQEWQAFYKRHFGIEVDVNAIDMPPRQIGYDRIIVIAGDLSYEKIILTMRKQFDVLFVNKYLPNYFDNYLTNTRNNNETYAIRVKNNTESGELDLGSAGIEKISPGGNPPFPVINEMTLKERLLFEMKYHEETRAHLDLETFTVCAGSHFKRDSLALSPAVGWKAGIDEFFTPYLYISECYDIYTIDGMYSRNVLVGN